MNKTQLTAMWNDGPINTLASRIFVLVGFFVLASFLFIGMFMDYQFSDRQVIYFSFVWLFSMFHIPFLLQKASKSKKS